MLLAAMWLGIAGCTATAQAPAPAQIVAPPALSAELSAGKYVRGDDSAPVTIVEFADYQCPYCAQEEPILQRLLRDYESRIRLVFHDYPVGHPHSMELAQAARCAGEQGGFWAMHDFLFKRAETVDIGRLAQYASGLGLDGEALDACVKSGRYRKSVEADAAAAQKAGVRGTPTFFVNGKRLDGWQTYNQLAGTVDAALESLAASRNGLK
jgi:protein-disulfide isomerase